MKPDHVKANAPYYLWKLSNRLYLLKIPVLPLLIKVVLRFVFGAVIPFETKIGKNVHLGYNGLGIVIHGRCVIGNNVVISQHVSLGGRGDEGVPEIGDNVLIGAGAIILGGIKIGNNAKIGANAVVLIDVPAGATAVGVPARLLIKN
jgi:serine O-acetyltransferase